MYTIDGTTIIICIFAYIALATLTTLLHHSLARYFERREQMKQDQLAWELVAPQLFAKIDAKHPVNL